MRGMRKAPRARRNQSLTSGRRLCLACDGTFGSHTYCRKDSTAPELHVGHGCVAYVLARNRPELLQMQSRRHCTRQSVYMCSSRTFEYLLLKISTEATPETCRMAARSVSSESPRSPSFKHALSHSCLVGLGTEHVGKCPC